MLIVNGAQHGLAVAAMAMLQPGDVVAVDALTYPGFKVLAQALRLELAPLPAAADGPDLDALAQLCATRRVRALYTMPTLHNPLGWVTSAVPASIGGDRPRAWASHHRGCRLCVPGGAAAGPAGSAGAGVDHLRLRAVQERGDRPARRIRRGPNGIHRTFERAIRATTWNTPA